MCMGFHCRLEKKISRARLLALNRCIPCAMQVYVATADLDTTLQGCIRVQVLAHASACRQCTHARCSQVIPCA